MIMKSIVLTLVLSLVASGAALASGHGGGKEENEIPVSNISYFDLAPEIVTNYTAEGNRVGYVRVKVQIMTDSPAEVEILKYHYAALRDIVISTLYKKEYNDVSTLLGRQEITQECKRKIEDYLLAEEDRKIVREVIFTNFIFQ